MKPIFITLLIVSILLGTYSQTCPSHCTACANSTSCTTCQGGFFLLNGASCPQCPPYCTACTAGPDGRPTCSACESPAQLAGGKCFTCQPSCQTCSGSPRNCTACPAGKILTTRTDGTKQCKDDPSCPIPNCATCTTLTDFPNYTQCQMCKPGFFRAQKRCVPCPFPCQDCTIDGLAILTDKIRPFWQSVITQARTDAVLPNPQPPFLAWIQGTDTTNGTNVRSWIKAFVLVQMIAVYVPAGSLNYSTILKDSIAFLPSLAGLNPQQQNGKIIQKFRTYFNLNWTIQQFYINVDKLITTLVTCYQCGPSFKLDATTSTCIPCPPNCVMCNNGPCTQCTPGYYVSTGTCSKCTAPCQTCGTSATQCRTCVPPTSFDPTTATCISCTQPCATCSTGSLSTCITCKQPYSLDANPTNGVCYRCNQDLCLKCTHDNTSICLQCKVGTTLNAGQCQQCPIPNCAMCNIVIGVAPTCFQCKEGFSLTSTSTCAPCGPGCLKCLDGNSTVCLNCGNGLFLNTTTGQCRKCKEGCLECTNAESCSSFADGIVYINQVRVQCRPGCKVCDPTSPDQCLTCQDRFFYDNVNKLCKSCEPGCAQCSDGTTCTKCLPNLHLSTNDCVSCSGNCRTCLSTNLTQCLTCKKGYTLLTTNFCQHLCQTGCQECDATNSSICLKCIQGHALTTDGKCIKCLGSCSGSCDPKNINICLGCVNGFQLLNNKCVRCSFGCLTCLNSQCSQCAPQFKLTQTSTGFVCKQRCKFPCLTCSGTTCSSCQGGYKLQSNICVPDLSCNPICQFCPAGTYKDITNYNCVACVSNCATCTTNADCNQCVDGYYLNAGTCTVCPAQCKTCYNQQSCKICSPGFTKQIVSMSSTSSVSDAVYSDKCIPCDANCRTCTVQPDRCTSCPQGFRLFSYRCAGMYTVGYVYQLNLAFSTFLTSGQSQRFLQAIAAILGINSKDNYINQLRQGSTVVGGTASANSQSSATSMMSSLGASVPGYSVSSFSASVYYGDQKVPQEQQGNKVNVGLIVGVVVGGVALIGIIVGIIVYKKIQAAKAGSVVVQDGRHQGTMEIKDMNNQISYGQAN